MTRALLLIDMDAFFASVEQARRPELRGQPVIVGGAAESRGVVSTASYEARACGVRTAMPAAQAIRLCPQGVFLPVDMAAYKAAQGKLLQLYGRFTDLVEPVSIDEAFLDVTGSGRLFGTPQEIARQIHSLTRSELELSCSIGIGPTRTLAKLACELEKPGGLTTLTPADVHGRLRDLPASALSGIGPVSQQRLAALGITTIGELQDAPPSLLKVSFTAAGAAQIKELALGGTDEVVHSSHAAPKSIGHEVTFTADTSDRELLASTLLDLADRTAAALRRQGYVCRTLTLKLRDGSFRTRTRQCSLPTPANSTRIIHEAALGLLAAAHAPGEKLRLLGLTLSGLAGDERQLELGEGSPDLACDAAVDAVRAKYGAAALRRAGADLGRRHDRRGRGSSDDRR
jgi:DNA polymerase-4